MLQLYVTVLQCPFSQTASLMCIFFALMKVCNPVKTGPVKTGLLCNHQKCSGLIRLTYKRSIYQSLFPFLMKTRFFLQYQNINDNLQSQRISFFHHEPYLKLNFSESTNQKNLSNGPASKLIIFLGAFLKAEYYCHVFLKSVSNDFTAMCD